MQIGKVSPAVFERSLYRPMKMAGVLSGQVRPEADVWRQPDLRRPGPDGGGAYVHALASGILDTACHPTGQMLAAQALNSLPLSAEAGSEALFLSLILPGGMEETELKAIADQIACAAGRGGAAVCGMTARVSGAVSSPVLTLQASARTAGSADLERELSEQDLVMAGYAGEAGTAILARDLHSSLTERLPESLLDKAALPEEDFMIRRRAAEVLDLDGRGDQDRDPASRETGLHRGKMAARGIVSSRAVAEGGVFGALWNLGAELDCGFEADLQRVPIRQETIEICEVLQLNPYQLYGTGALLIACIDGEETASRLRGAGIAACPIGRMRPGRERVALNRGSRRSLEKPRQDMLYAALQG